MSRNSSQSGRRGRGRGTTRTRARRDFDADRFTTAENHSWFDSHVNNAFIYEKSVAGHVDTQFQLRAAFATLGWERILDHQDFYCPILIREFYANIQEKEKQGWHDIRSSVRGQPIVITQESLAELLGVPNAGPIFEQRRDTIVYDPAFIHREAVSRLGLGYHATARGPTLLTKFMGIRERLLVYLYGFNVLPRASGLNELRVSDLYFLDKMISGLGDIAGVPLASIIIPQMRDVVRTARANKNLVYPFTITRILAAHGIDFSDEELVRASGDHLLTDVTLTSCGYILVGGIWRNPHYGYRAERDQEDRAPGRRSSRRSVRRDTTESEEEYEIPDEVESVHAPGADPSTSAGPSTARHRPTRPRSGVTRLLRAILTSCTRIEETQHDIIRRLDQHEEQLAQLRRDRSSASRPPPSPSS